MASLIRKVISTAKAPGAIGPYSQAVLVDRTVYISGQLGMDPASGQLVPGGVAEEAKQISRVVFLQELLTRLLLCPKEAMWRLRQSLSKDLSQQRLYKWVQSYLVWNFNSVFKLTS
ncbi:2-iminobutanoate/2-iminopropanoate deaminase isoform X2 [Neomonachus schauinslandi]|uniref:2-iminobutanoate/2-iminopropanoate deaminase isoform X2 n=1 Tax=Neomonachus schauinslandi TaxID=29088 RepID=A0A2Y9H3V1_NEOSC|nr:2-iminobutanoate/2-iminopropanoate deaminase isoform X2 [Neomonachus schauinslandi]